MECAERFGELRARARADQRHDAVSFHEHPRNGQLRDGHALLGRQLLQRFNQTLIPLAILAGEAREMRAEVSTAEGLEPLNRPRESTP